MIKRCLMWRMDLVMSKKIQWGDLMLCELQNLGPDGFERLIQSLLAGETYGDGPDGQREVVIREATQLSALPGLTVSGYLMAQVKFKSQNTKQNDWTWLRSNLKDELDGFRKKAARNDALRAEGKTDDFYHLPDTWLFFTNQILTPVEKNGLKDKADAFAVSYKDLIPRIYILGADDVKTMLDNRPMVASAYPQLVNEGFRSHQILRSYAERCFTDHACVDLKQAGDETSRFVDLRDVYTDLSVNLNDKTRSFSEYIVDMSDSLFKQLENAKESRDLLYSKTDLLSHATHHQQVSTRFVLVGEAGGGKSTVSRLLCQIFRAALLREGAAPPKEALAYADASEQTEALPVPRYSRISVSVPLKDFAAWMKGRYVEACALDLYLCDRINDRTHSMLTGPDLCRLLQSEAWFFCFDGLDEVPAASNRSQVIDQLRRFQEMLDKYGCNHISVLTSRPQGYDNNALPDPFQKAILLPMEPDRCMGYLRRLLPYIERDSDEQKAKLRVMENALQDPTTAKLMETPLYATILLILARSGGRLPSRRYDLFKQYCDTVIRREQQKDMLYNLGGYNWVFQVHRTLGLRLQKESSTSENAAAELTIDQLENVLLSYLDRNGCEEDCNTAVAKMEKSIIQRLPFMAQTTTSTGAACVLFPLRSIQEYYAAEGILALQGPNEIGIVLKEISRSTYWRNVFLFVAGCLTGDLEKYDLLNDRLYNICRMNNGDSGYCLNEETAEIYKLTNIGSRIALDLLHEGIFSRPLDKQRYSALLEPMLSEPLERAGDYEDLLEKFCQLPAGILKNLLQEILIPQLQDSYNGDCLGFVILWKLASTPNALPEAASALLDIAPQVRFQKDSGIWLILLELGDVSGVPSAAERLWHLTTESMGAVPYWINITNETMSNFVSMAKAQKLKQLPDSVLRRLLLYSLRMSAEEIERHSLYYDELAGLEPLFSLKNLKPICALCSRTVSSKDMGFYYQPVPLEDEIPDCLENYLNQLRMRGLSDISTLLELQAHPNPRTHRAVCDMFQGADKQTTRLFLSVLYRCSWYCRMVAVALYRSESVFSALPQTEIYEQEKRLRTWIEDPASAIRSKQWEKQICVSPRSTKLSLTTFELLPLLRSLPLNENLCEFLSRLSTKEDQLSIEMLAFLLEHLPELETIEGAGSLVLRLFTELPIQDIKNGRFVWPTDILYCYFFSDKQRLSVWDKIRNLTLNTESAVWEALSLIPPIYLFERTPWTLPEGCYEHARTTNNDAALLGCILTLLSTSLHRKDRDLLEEDLQRFLSEPNFLWFFSNCFRHFCLEGQLEIYHVAQNVLPIDDEHQDKLLQFINSCVESIREGLQDAPVNLDALEKKTSHRN